MVVHRAVHEDLITTWAEDNLVFTKNSEEYLKDLYRMYKESLPSPEECLAKKDFHSLLRDVANDKLIPEKNIEKVSSIGSKQGVLFLNVSLRNWSIVENTAEKQQKEKENNSNLLLTKLVV